MGMFFPHSVHTVLKTNGLFTFSFLLFQLLYLWDLVLAYDSMEVFPLLASAILSFRRDNLMTVVTYANIEAVLSDLCSLPGMAIRVVEFSIGGTKLERFLPKNQHTQRK